MSKESDKVLKNRKKIISMLESQLNLKAGELGEIDGDCDVGTDIKNSFNIQTKETCLEFELEDYINGGFSYTEFFESLDKDLKQIGRYRQILNSDYYFTRL